MRFIFLTYFFCLSVSATPFKGSKFVVAGPSSHSPFVSKMIYNKGGNVVDMAIAVAFALCVTHPYYVSLGSGGFALVKINSLTKSLDFRETAPHKMSSDFFEKNNFSSQTGAFSIGVPGFVAGMMALHKKYGKLSWSELLAPALFLAEKGYPVSGDWLNFTNQSKKQFNLAGKSVFFKKGKSYSLNENFKQKSLATAFKLLQKKGGDAFYRGDIGKDVVSSIQKEKGLLSLQDLEKYKVRWLKPLVFKFRSYEISSMPLPSSGGIILARAFRLIEKQKLYKKTLGSFDETHLLAEIMSLAFLPRYLMGDFEFSNFKPELYLSDKNLKELSDKISLEKSVKMPLIKESGETTHFSIIDKKGNTVAMTLTLNGIYGSKLVSSRYGVVLNNQIDDFTTLMNQANQYGLIQGENNLIQGGKRPLSSMSPTLVEKNKQTLLSLGGAGGPAIITGVLQTIYRYLVHNLNLEEALYYPRIHHQFLPRELFVEDKRFSPERIVSLKMKGHKIKFTNHVSRVFAVARNKKGELLAKGDFREMSSAGGL
ncbi:MAG: gamma-glutamyltransferase [Bdellovibrionales bacterium]|nr:gamma-glutamyltransferase [Bdellovibrionales bacterium]